MHISACSEVECSASTALHGTALNINSMPVGKLHNKENIMHFDQSIKLIVVVVQSLLCSCEIICNRKGRKNIKKKTLVHSGTKDIDV